MMMMMREKFNFQRHTIFVDVGRLSAVKIFRATRERPGAQRERKSVIEWELFLCNIWKCCLHSFTSSQQLDRLTLDFSRKFFSTAFHLLLLPFVISLNEFAAALCACYYYFFDSMCTALSQLERLHTPALFAQSDAFIGVCIHLQTDNFSRKNCIHNQQSQHINFHSQRKNQSKARFEKNALFETFIKVE